MGSVVVAIIIGSYAIAEGRRVDDEDAEKE
jgi:hypothetical protein